MIFAITFIKRRENSARCRHYQNMKIFLTGRLIIPWRGCRTGCPSSTSQRCHSGVVHLEAGNGARLDPYPQAAAHGDRVHTRPARTTHGHSQYDWHHVRLTHYQADAGFVSKPWPATPGIARSTTPRRQGDGGKSCASLNGISLASHLPPCAPCNLRARYWLGPYVGPSYVATLP